MRADLRIFKHVQAEIPLVVDPAGLLKFVQYRCIVGSTAYGLSQVGSDVDRRGFYLAPADLEWSLSGLPAQLETDSEEVYWELEKFIRLALKANPNVLECLYSPMVETCTPIANELIEMRHAFLSRHVHRTYNAYVLSQFTKLEQDLRAHGQIRWKHVMHLVRLLLSGIVVLTEGFVPVSVEGCREHLLAIRRGEIPWDHVERWRLSLHRKFDDALESTPLPEHPDYSRANQFLIRARRAAASAEYGR
ncbi:MAG: nucleotidyltransferase domain-containing protein [Bryobacteraceae bacterium]|nr:nucleotidyltransferase domain-containing protein [Bryobacteraceae bacterium]